MASTQQTEEKPRRKIFIAIDGSAQADLAFTWYLENMMRQEDNVYLVHSAEYKVNIPLPGKAANIEAITKVAQEENERIETLIGTYTERLRPHHVHTNPLVVMGKKPGEAIIHEATEKGANAIIMGSRGLGTVRRTMMGSVSDYVMHHAPSKCSVTVIRDN